MLFSEKSEYSSFEYKSRQSHFNRILIEWKGIVLNPSNTDNPVFIDLSFDPLTELLFDIYGHLSFIEIAEFYGAIQNKPILQENINWDLFFNRQNLVWNTRSEQIINKVLQTDESFKSWAFERKLSSADLMPLNALNDFFVFNQLAPHFTSLMITRSDGKRIIDLLVDLILMEKDLETLSPKPNQNWLEQLVKIRFPMTVEKDTVEINNQPLGALPQFMNLTQFRQGDRLMNRLQITFTDSKDLKQKLTRLELEQ